MSGLVLSQWKFFDKIFCISIEDRIDRQQQVKIQFEKVGLLSFVEFILVRRHPENCEQGIYESHLYCIQKALDAHADTILIFEDDIIFDRFTPDILNSCIKFLSSDIEWKLFFMGCLVKKSNTVKNNSSILKIKYRSLTHAYVLNRKSAKLILKKKWENIAYDGMLRTLNKDVYTVYPSFAFQSNSSTDNLNYLTLDKFRKFCGGLKRIQKLNELYHRYKTIVILVHLYIVLFFLFWIF